MTFWSKLWHLVQNPRSEVVSTAGLLDELARLATDTWAGISVTPEEAMQYPPLATAVRVLEQGCAQLPLHVFRNTNERSREIDREFHVAKRLKRPNDWMTGYHWRAWNIRHASTTGNAFSLINRNGRTGEINELLPLHPARVEVEQLRNWEVVYHVSLRDGGTRTYPASRIFHFHGPTEDGVTGIDIIKKHRQSIALAIAQDRLASNLFSRGALMTGSFSTSQKLTPVQRKDNEEALRQAYSGENAGGFALMDGDLKFSPMMMDFEKAQLLEARKLQRTVVVSLLRVPMHMAGDLDKATFSNIHNLARQAVDYTFMPWLVDFEAAIEQQLMTEEERATHFPKHNVTSLLRGAPQERAEFYASGIQNKWMSANEAREKEDMNPYEGGDEFHGAENIFGGGESGEEPEGGPSNRVVRIAQAQRD